MTARLIEHVEDLIHYHYARFDALGDRPAALRLGGADPTPATATGVVRDPDRVFVGLVGYDRENRTEDLFTRVIVISLRTFTKIVGCTKKPASSPLG